MIEEATSTGVAPYIFGASLLVTILTAVSATFMLDGAGIPTDNNKLNKLLSRITFLFIIGVFWGTGYITDYWFYGYIPTELFWLILLGTIVFVSFIYYSIVINYYKKNCKKEKDIPLH